MSDRTYTREELRGVECPGVHASAFCERCGAMYGCPAADPVNLCGRCRQMMLAAMDEEQSDGE
jgi:hypothetical protein